MRPRFLIEFVYFKKPTHFYTFTMTGFCKNKKNRAYISQKPLRTSYFTELYSSASYPAAFLKNKKTLRKSFTIASCVSSSINPPTNYIGEKQMRKACKRDFVDGKF